MIKACWMIRDTGDAIKKSSFPPPVVAAKPPVALKPFVTTLIEKEKPYKMEEVVKETRWHKIKRSVKRIIIKGKTLWHAKVK